MDTKPQAIGKKFLGKVLSTDEIFMAWYYAVFANELNHSR
jgi:hypothetical protein